MLKVSNRPTAQTASVEAMTPEFLSASELCANICTKKTFSCYNTNIYEDVSVFKKGFFIKFRIISKGGKELFDFWNGYLPNR